MPAEEHNCVRCGSAVTKGSSYCASCGTPFKNRCCDIGTLLGDPCGNVCGPQDAFCPKCGSITTFVKAGLLHTPYYENKMLQEDELEEMNWFSHRFFET